MVDFTPYALQSSFIPPPPGSADKWRYASHLLNHLLNIVVLFAFASFNDASSASLSSRDMMSGSLLEGMRSKWDEKQ